MSRPSLSVEAGEATGVLLALMPVAKAQRLIRGLPATQNVKIDLSKRIVQVWVRPGETIQDDQLRKLIRDAGFDVREIKHIKLSP